MSVNKCAECEPTVDALTPVWQVHGRSHLYSGRDHLQQWWLFAIETMQAEWLLPIFEYHAIFLLFTQVFVTVGSAAKRDFLLETFVRLQADHIGNSRSTSFEGLVRNLTKGKGVHLVLNSLSDDKLQVILLLHAKH